MSKIAFVMTGPTGGQIIEMPDEDFDQAIKDGWAIDFEAANLGGNPDPFAGFNTEPHAKAEAWLEKRGLYSTREMRPAKPDKDADSKPASKPESDEPEIAKPKGKPGRPPKS